MILRRCTLPYFAEAPCSLWVVGWHLQSHLPANTHQEIPSDLLTPLGPPVALAAANTTIKTRHKPHNNSLHSPYIIFGSPLHASTYHCDVLFLQPHRHLGGVTQDLVQGGSQGAVVIPPHSPQAAKPLGHLFITLQWHIRGLLPFM